MSDQDLMEELRNARRARTKAEIAEQEAKAEFSRMKAARMSAAQLVEEILEEIETGKSGRPLIDRINAAGNSNGDGAATDAPPLGLTPPDLERELRHALDVTAREYPERVWPRLIETGCDDVKILDVLRAIWPHGYRALDGTGPLARRVGCTFHGGPNPAFWVGPRKSTVREEHPPDLTGLALADRVRTLLGIPRAPAPDPAPNVADKMKVRRQKAGAK